jgi:hypothetical protein
LVCCVCVVSGGTEQQLMPALKRPVLESGHPGESIYLFALGL